MRRVLAVRWPRVARGAAALLLAALVPEHGGAQGAATLQQQAAKPQQQAATPQQQPVKKKAAAQQAAVQMQVVPPAAQVPAQVPRMLDVRDSTLTVARQLLLRRFKANPGVTLLDTPDSARDQRVADQSPAPGTPITQFPVDVQLTVYRYVPAQPLTVPSVVGRPLPLAVVQIRRSRLALADRGMEYSDSIPAGSVTRQHPDAGTAAQAGDSVEVWTSRGAHPVEPTLTMPRLVGRTLDEATERLAPLGLQLTHADTVEDAANAGRIVGQSPDEGRVVHASDAVVVRVAVAPPQAVDTLRAPIDTLPPPPDTLPPSLDTLSRVVAVPLLESLPLDSARQVVRAAGLTLGTPQVFGRLRDSVVATQVPLAGTLVPRGTAVTVALVVQPSLPPAPPEVPWWRVLLYVVMGGALAYALYRLIPWPVPNPIPPDDPGPDGPLHPPARVTLVPAEDSAPHIQHPPAKSLVSVSVTFADAPPVTTLDHAGTLVAGEEVAHDRRR